MHPAQVLFRKDDQRGDINLSPPFHIFRLLIHLQSASTLIILTAPQNRVSFRKVGCIDVMGSARGKGGLAFHTGSLPADEEVSTPFISAVGINHLGGEVYVCQKWPVEVRGPGPWVGECFPLHLGGDDVHEDEAGEFEMRGACIVDGEAVGDPSSSVVADEEDISGAAIAVTVAIEGDVEDRGEGLKDGAADRSFGVLAGWW